MHQMLKMQQSILWVKKNEFRKKVAASKVSEITFANNKIKDIIKVIKSLEKKAIFLKGTTKKAISQKRVFNDSLMRVGLSLMKNLLTPLTKYFCYY